MLPPNITARSYALAIQKALRAEYGHLKSMVQEITETTGASSGAVKNWLAGVNGPSGEHLIKLMAASDEVYDAVQALAGLPNINNEARQRIRQAIAALRGKDVQ